MSKESKNDRPSALGWRASIRLEESMEDIYGNRKHCNSNNEGRSGKAERHQGMVAFIVHCSRALVETMHFQCKTFSCNALR